MRVVFLLLLAITSSAVAIRHRCTKAFDDPSIRIPQKDVKAIPTNGGECLSTHNELRALHRNTLNLVWDSDLARQAQQYANQLAAKLKHMHSPRSTRPNQGENLAWSWAEPDTTLPRTCDNAIRAWYNEIQYYNWATGGRKGGVRGHFTQVVWKNSKKLGMGISVVKRDGCVYTFIVARYSPTGNVWRVGETPKYLNYLRNVMPLKGVATPCDGNPCANGGTCISMGSRYKCECRALYTGNNCQIKQECEDIFKWCKYNVRRGICRSPHYLPRCLKTCGKCSPKK